MTSYHDIEPAVTASQVEDVTALLAADAIDPKNKAFLGSLCDAHVKYKGLTAKQAYWMDKLFNEMMRAPLQPKDIPVTDNATAAPLPDDGMARLKEIILKSNLYFTIAGLDIKCYWNAKYGSMTVCHRNLFPSYYGALSFKQHSIKLSTNNSSEFDIELTSLLRGLANKPDETIAKYGIASGSCGMCGKELTDPKSIAVGIGPVCQKKMGYKAQ